MPNFLNLRRMRNITLEWKVIIFKALALSKNFLSNTNKTNSHNAN